MIEANSISFKRDEWGVSPTCDVNIRDEGGTAVFVDAIFHTDNETVRLTFEAADAKILGDELRDRASEVRAILDTEEALDDA